MEEKLQNLTFGKASLIGLVLAGAYWLMSYDDGVTKEAQIQNLDNDIAKQTKEISSINKAIDDAERFQQKMTDLGLEMERVLLAMPSQLTSQQLMSDISNQAKVIGVEINRLSPGANFRQSAPSKDEVVFYEPVMVELDISGTYNQMMLFLSNLTKLDKIITAEKLELKSVQGPVGSSVPKITMTASFVAYRYLAPPKEEGK